MLGCFGVRLVRLSVSGVMLTVAGFFLSVGFVLSEVSCSCRFMAATMVLILAGIVRFVFAWTVSLDKISMICCCCCCCWWWWWWSLVMAVLETSCHGDLIQTYRMSLFDCTCACV